jgi:hypothetical protein
MYTYEHGKLYTQYICISNTNNNNNESCLTRASVLRKKKNQAISLHNKKTAIQGNFKPKLDTRTQFDQIERKKLFFLKQNYNNVCFEKHTEKKIYKRKKHSNLYLFTHHYSNEWLNINFIHKIKDNIYNMKMYGRHSIHSYK